MKNSAILLISCPDRKGEVATIADFVYRHNGNILHADEHADEESGLFLMRVEFDPKDFDIDLADFGKYFSPVAEAFSMKWRLAQSSHRERMIILVSKYDHCLVDLLYRHRNGELACEIAAIISNHPDAKRHADFYGIPYHLVPVTKENKPAAEEQELELLRASQVDLIVLARYMQVLSSGFIRHYPQQIININHSFLPAFIGAKPHHQAYERGVKLIGATAHYVTEELDAGPIIEQDVIRVSHRDDVTRLRQLGADIERITLARAVESHCEDRVLLHGATTVVF